MVTCTDRGRMAPHKLKKQIIMNGRDHANPA
jgi:hypothetical protein